jgi:hypothetical protein
MTFYEALTIGVAIGTGIGAIVFLCAYHYG